MNKIADSNPKLQTKQEIYIPLEAFHDQLSKIKSVHYKSELSFKPVFQRFKETKKKERKASSGIFSILEDFEKELLKLEDLKLLSTEKTDKVEALIRLLFPSLFFEGQIGFISKPFTKEFTLMTPAMHELFASKEWELKITDSMIQPKASQTALQAGSCILDKLYGGQKGIELTELMSIRHKKTHLEKHYKINIITDFINVTSLKPLKKLSKKQIFQLLNEWDNADLWLECFPPENFLFEGLVIGYLSDVTDVEILSQLKAKIVENDESKSQDELFGEITSAFRSFLEMPEIVFGNMASMEIILEMGSSWTIIGNVDVLTSLTLEAFNEGLYGKVRRNKAPVLIGDLRQLNKPSSIDQILIDKGYRSLLLSPISNSEGELLGVFELASTKPYRFAKITMTRLKEAISLFELGINHWLSDLDNQVNLFVQQQYTSIHPSVEWKFLEVSRRYLWNKNFNDENMVLEPIVFKDIYPLYAQADIVGSSTIRNKSIESDLIDNLERVGKVMKACKKSLYFDLLDIYLSKVENNLDRLKRGKFVSSDESQIVDLLSREIHPFFTEIQNKYQEAPKSILEDYFDYLDPKLKIVYRKRKAYEESVSQLNKAISEYIESEDEKKAENSSALF